MSETKNVGTLDGAIRIVLGVACLGATAYHFLRAPLFPPYVVIGVIVLIPFFLKTGITRVCPLMAALKISTNR